MEISVCMIVRNEEAVLEQSLHSMCPHVAEIIIVDTGSTDRTKEAAQNYTSKIYDFPWCGDFSAARNFSLEKAANDWVLVLDADEILTSFNIKQIKSALKYNGDDMVGRIKIVNILTDAIGEKRQIEKVSRLFNRSYFQYEGTIHEQLVRKDRQPFRAIPVDITVYHTGYTREALKRTNKIARNRGFLEQALQQDPEDTYLLYQLGKTLYMAKDYPKAVDCFQRALSLPVNFQLEYVKNLLETYGYALIKSEKFSEALILRDYLQYYDGSADFLFLMGLIYMNNGMFPLAIENFTKCCGKKEGKAEGVNSYLPKYNIGVIYECLGRIEEAKHYYSQCGSYPLALNRLKLLTNK